MEAERALELVNEAQPRELSGLDHQPTSNHLLKLSNTYSHAPPAKATIYTFPPGGRYPRSVAPQIRVMSGRLDKPSAKGAYYARLRHKHSKKCRIPLTNDDSKELNVPVSRGEFDKFLQLPYVMRQLIWEMTFEPRFISVSQGKLPNILSAVFKGISHLSSRA